MEVALPRELRCQKGDVRESERAQPRVQRLGGEEGDPRLAHLGSTLGAAILGAVLSWGLVHTTSGQAITTDQLRALLNGTGLVSGDAEAVRLALQDGLHATFLTMLLFAVLIVPACLFVPRDAVHKDEPVRA